MACPEIYEWGLASRQMQSATFNNYITKLQSRYGDPRQYAQQAEAMRKEEAALLFEESRQRENLLRDAYVRTAVRNRHAHEERINKRGAKSQTQRPGIEAPPALAHQTRPEPAGTRMSTPQPAAQPDSLEQEPSAPESVAH